MRRFGAGFSLGVRPGSSIVRPGSSIDIRRKHRVGRGRQIVERLKLFLQVRSQRGNVRGLQAMQPGTELLDLGLPRRGDGDDVLGLLLRRGDDLVTEIS